MSAMLSRLMGVRIFDLEACGACNLACPFCPRERLPPVGNMSQETFTAFLDQVPLGVADTLSFVGIGEPTLNRSLPDFIRQAKSRYARVRTWVTSNGTLLNRRTVPALLDAGLDTLDVSFNGLDAAAYEAQMKGAEFAQVLANLEYTAGEIARSGSALRLQINYILSRENAAREEEIRAFWLTRGITRFRVQHLHDRAGLAQVSGLTPLDSPGLRRNSCALFETITFITWEGDVLYCCHDIPRGHKIGNLRRDGWDRIQRRKRWIVRERAWPAMCGSCTDPLRHDLREKLDSMIGQELSATMAGGLRATLKAARTMAGI